MYLILKKITYIFYFYIQYILLILLLNFFFNFNYYRKRFKNPKNNYEENKSDSDYQSGVEPNIIPKKIFSYDDYLSTSCAFS